MEDDAKVLRRIRTSFGGRPRELEVNQNRTRSGRIFFLCRILWPLHRTENQATENIYMGGFVQVTEREIRERANLLMQNKRQMFLSLLTWNNCVKNDVGSPNISFGFFLQPRDASKNCGLKPELTHFYGFPFY